MMASNGLLRSQWDRIKEDSDSGEEDEEEDYDDDDDDEDEEEVKIMYQDINSHIMKMNRKSRLELNNSGEGFS
jgi:hypothetical protein